MERVAQQVLGIHVPLREYLERSLAGMFRRQPDMSGDQRKRLMPHELAGVQRTADDMMRIVAALSPAQADAASLPLVDERMREALEPLVHFIDQWDRAPLRKIDDEFYGIHVGTEFEASLRLSDFRKLRDTLTATKPSGQVERAFRAGWQACRARNGDLSPGGSLREQRHEDNDWQAFAALSPQSQPAAQSESHTA